MTTILGWKTKDFVLLASDKQATGFNIKSEVTKIIPISCKSLVAGCGTLGGIQQVSKLARQICVSTRAHSGTYDLECTATETSEAIANINFSLPLEFKRFTPIGFLVGGVDSYQETILNSIDSAGGMIDIEEYFTDGSGGQMALSLLQEKYDLKLNELEAGKVLIEILKAVSKKEAFTGLGFDVWVVSRFGAFDINEKDYVPLSKRIEEEKEEERKTKEEQKKEVTP